MGKRFLIFVNLLLLTSIARASEVPPLTAAELGEEASNVWLFLAGEGFWGAIVVALAGFVFKLLRPYILAWVDQHKLGKLYLAIEACVANINATYVEGMKAANADGKLTEDEKHFVFMQCKQQLIIFMQTQGVDIIREYGDVAVDALIELILSRMKNPLVKAVVGPLSGSAPLPESVSLGVMPG